MKKLYFIFITLFTQSLAAEKTQNWLSTDLGLVHMASYEVLKDALGKVESSSEFSGLLIKLDTPGGELEATRKIVQIILGSKKPVAVWVTPSGARAGSAGAFITLAADRGLMAPGTNIGASAPISSQGEIKDKTLKQKVQNDTLAFMESIAEERGRDKDSALLMVSEAKSYTAEKALELGLIDRLCESVQACLGESVKVTIFEASWSQRFLVFLANPNLFYFLFSAGLLGLGFELTHPGAIVPGVVGAICIILSFLVSSSLPLNAGALSLCILGVFFIVLEFFVSGFGALGIGGAVAFALGSFFLIDGTQSLGLDINPLFLVSVSFTFLLIAIFVSYLLFRSRKSLDDRGLIDELKGEEVELLNYDPTTQMYQVRWKGEIWKAKSASDARIQSGSARIISRKNLTLIIGE